MPQRSNLFQRLVLVLHEALAPEWNVTESKMLLDRASGELREVDIVASKLVMGHEMLLCIECRDHGRPADVTWVDSMAQKHTDLPTSKLVLWSSSGFTRGAKAKAGARKIDIVSQANATEHKWAFLARKLIGGKVQYLQPKFAGFVDVLRPGGSFHRFEDVRGMNLHDRDGRVTVSMDAMLQHVEGDKRVASVLLDHAPDGSGNFWINIDLPHELFAFLDGVLCRTHRIGFGIVTQTGHAPLQSRSAVHEDKVVTLASAELPAATLEVLFEETESGSRQVRNVMRPKPVGKLSKKPPKSPPR